LRHLDIVELRHEWTQMKHGSDQNQTPFDFIRVYPCSSVAR